MGNSTSATSATQQRPTFVLPGMPTAQQLAAAKAAKETRNKVGHELEKRYPDFKLVFSEMKKLSKDEAADFVRKLRLEHHGLYEKLGHQAMTDDPDTKATILADEPQLSEKIVKDEARRLAKAPDVGPNHTLDVLHGIPKNERADVLREIEQSDKSQMRWLRQVCRDTQDPEMLAAFRELGGR